MISARTRAILQRAGARFLNQRCTLSQLKSGTNQYAGPSNTEIVLAEDVPVRLIKMGDTEAARFVGEQERILDTYKASFMAGADITTNTRVTMDDSGFVYEVVQVESELTDSIFTTAIITRAR